MSYALTILWYERQRFQPAILAVGFSALLIALQSGLLLGMLSFATLPIEHSEADLWVGGPGVASVDVCYPIPEGHLTRVAAQPEVERCEIYLQAFSSWERADGSSELCILYGSRLEEGSLGALRELTLDLRARLTEPLSVVVDESDRHRLGIQEVGDFGEITGRRVRVVGLVRGLRGLLGARVFCSIETARQLLIIPGDQTIFLLARCHDPADASAVAARLRGAYPDLSAHTRAEFAWRTQLHWLTKTKGGIALGYAAALGLLAGAIITSQTLYAAVAATQREYAVLWAQGIPRWRTGALILAQSFWVGVAGSVLALPPIFVLAWAADVLGVKVLLPVWLLATTVAITLAMALMSSLAALRLLRLIEPALLLR